MIKTSDVLNRHMKYGFQTIMDPCIFIKKFAKKDEITIIGAYVDELTYGGP